VHNHTGGPRWKVSEAPHINDSSSPLSGFLYFAEIITLLVVQTIRYYHCYLRLSWWWTFSCAWRKWSRNVCLSGNNNKNETLYTKPTDRSPGNKKAFYTPLYSDMMKWDRYLHNLQFLHLTDNRNETGKTDENYDRLWKIFEILNKTFSKFYNPSIHLAIDKIIVIFKGRVIFKQYIQKIKNTNASA
jgi:hypothetical protein